MLPMETPKPKFIDSFWTFLVATLFVGPFALPLLWRNPRYKRSTKIIGSVVVLAFTALLIWFATSVMKPFMDDLDELMKLQ
jgi:hypothetical protein